MSPVNPLLVLPALAMALLTTRLFLKFTRKNPPHVTYKTIDGLRGYLAFFVFLHHSSFWYFYLHTHIWDEPPSHLYIHFGKTSVSLFFMITGFLFFTKLIESKRKPVDWLRLFVSRILRLYPVYLVAMVFCLIIIGVLSQWKMNESGNSVLFEIFQWSTFTIIGKPVINNTSYMENITAGVTWTLIYEWAFYLSLPIIGLIFFRSRVNFFILLLSIALVIEIYRNNPLRLIYFCSFGAGLLAAFFVRWEKFRLLISGKIFSMIATLCLVATVWFFQTPYALLPLTLIAIAFIIISGGNSMFGFFSNRVSRMLGQISYPVYLLHPILLFVTFRFIFGFNNASQFPPGNYWIIISICGSVLILICLAVHYFIELPIMNSTAKVTAGVRKIYFRVMEHYTLEKQQYRTNGKN